ncbi:MAG: superoxide dismutase family protein [Bryobacteraceae bacterium]
MLRLGPFLTTAIIGTLAFANALWAEQTIELKNSRGESVGTAKIAPASEGAPEMGVRFDLDLVNMPPGEHAVHIHATGRCEGPSFESAGPHFNPEKKSHGENNSLGPHAGDLKNITVRTDGTAKETLTAPKVALKAGTNALTASGGTALVIHEKADDYRSDPAGNAGERIACGVIK